MKSQKNLEFNSIEKTFCLARMFNVEYFVLKRRQFLAFGIMALLGWYTEPPVWAKASKTTDRKKKVAGGVSRKKRFGRKKSYRNKTDPSTGQVLSKNTVPSVNASQEKQPLSRLQASYSSSYDREPDLAPSSSRHFFPRQDSEPLAPDTPEDVRNYLIKMRNYDAPSPGDVILPPSGQELLHSVLARLNRLQGHIGHGHFYLLSIDEAVRYAKRPAVGAFPREEVEFLERMFHTDAAGYGFLDKKPMEAFTARINKNQVVKVPGMGNYIYKGAPFEKWVEIQKLLGEQVILTSGIRGVVKQFHLFLTKAEHNGGNLSLASRSLAPPGYSFHAVGDFDVGQRGFGVRNFMGEFTTTPVYHTLSERGYITLRYPRDNFLGVRFEPWHVKVVS